MSDQKPRSVLHDERLRDAARWYTRHESDTELTPAEWQEWEAWSADPNNSAEYDEFVQLHQQARTLIRSAMPSDEDIRVDVQRTSKSLESSKFARRFRLSDFRSPRPWAAMAAILLIVSVITFARLGKPFSSFEKQPAGTKDSVKPGEAVPFSEATLQDLRASGRPVLVNLRADWCGTCVVNERTALSRDSVREMMARKQVVYLKGDEANPSVSSTLRQFKRPGIPLYLLYCPGVSEPRILPERLTEDIVLSALSRLPDPDRTI